MTLPVNVYGWTQRQIYDHHLLKMFVHPSGSVWTTHKAPEEVGNTEEFVHTRPEDFQELLSMLCREQPYQSHGERIEVMPVRGNGVYRLVFSRPGTAERIIARKWNHQTWGVVMLSKRQRTWAMLEANGWTRFPAPVDLEGLTRWIPPLETCKNCPQHMTCLLQGMPTPESPSP